MKGELTLKILEFLEEAATTSIDLATAFLNTGYGASFNKINREFGRRHFARSLKSQQYHELFNKRKNFFNLIYKLKQEGLIAEDQKNHFLFSTRQGRQKFNILKNRFNKKLPKNIYEKEKDANFKIIIFDIPESQRYKRNWLRLVLASLDFTMLQKSVWIGKNKIPRGLIKDLEKFELLPFVEIFEISKTGSLKFVSGNRKV